MPPTPPTPPTPPMPDGPELPPVEIVGIELIEVDLRLVEPVETAQARWDARPVLLVSVTTKGGRQGWGECVALPEPLYSEETSAGAAALLANRLLPTVADAAAQGPVGPGEVAAAAESVARNSMAKAAVADAVLDACLAEAGVPLWRYLGATGQPVPAGVAFGIPADRSPERLRAAVDAAVAEGYRRAKVKIAPGWDRLPLEAVRAVHPGLVLVADANGSYAGLAPTDQEEALGALDDLGLAAVEQPLGPGDLDGHARLRARLGSPVALDESLDSLGSLALATDKDACDVAVIKAGRLGGLAEARRAAGLCAAAGIGAYVGGMYESAVGRAQNLALGGHPAFTLAGDLAAGDRYFVKGAGGDIGPLDAATGTFAVPAGPGRGLDVPCELRAGSGDKARTIWSWANEAGRPGRGT